MTEKKRVLITDQFSQEAFVTLSHQAYLQVEKSPTPDITKLDLKGTHALVIRSRTQISEDIFSRAKDLQVIITATSGFDHIDLEAAKKWGITVMFTPEANVESAAQLTWALALACASQLLSAHRMVKSGEWKRDLVRGRELHRKTYGIVGKRAGVD